jgi:hypothetical protein
MLFVATARARISVVHKGLQGQTVAARIDARLPLGVDSDGNGARSVRAAGSRTASGIGSEGKGKPKIQRHGRMVRFGHSSKLGVFRSIVGLRRLGDDDPSLTRPAQDMQTVSILPSSRRP